VDRTSPADVAEVDPLLVVGQLTLGPEVDRGVYRVSRDTYAMDMVRILSLEGSDLGGRRVDPMTAPQFDCFNLGLHDFS
jgi:hypothetical protein